MTYAVRPPALRETTRDIDLHGAGLWPLAILMNPELNPSCLEETQPSCDLAEFLFLGS